MSVVRSTKVQPGEVLIDSRAIIIDRFTAGTILRTAVT